MVFYPLPESCQGDHEERLIRDLGLVNGLYIPYARPVEEERQLLNLEFGISLQQIVDVVRSDCIQRFAGWTGRGNGTTNP